jgi:hypothetical protein
MKSRAKPASPTVAGSGVATVWIHSSSSSITPPLELLELPEDEEDELDEEELEEDDEELEEDDEELEEDDEELEEDDEELDEGTGGLGTTAGTYPGLLGKFSSGNKLLAMANSAGTAPPCVKKLLKYKAPSGTLLDE